MHKAAFLGSKGENSEELERLLLEVLRDHVFWRRNFHPSDHRLIEETDKQSEQYGLMIARLRDELFEILAELKRAAPHYSPRQIGHMVSDPTLPALVGYFAGMLYNQNNVVAEASPETVRKERAYIAALASMIAYPPLLPESLSARSGPNTEYSWGHLCSGGTVANLEALWVARNVRLFPLSVRLLTKTYAEFEHLGDVALRSAGKEIPFSDLTTRELINLPVHETTRLHVTIKRRLQVAGRDVAAAFEDVLPSVRKIGLAGLLHAYNDVFSDDRAQPPVVLITQAAHYGWSKAMDVAGLGAAGLMPVPVDSRIRMDVDALHEGILEFASAGRQVLAVVSTCGTTEETAVDPLHKVDALRRKLSEDGITFWHHCDAAFGGYFAAMLPKNDQGEFVSPDVARLSDPELVGEDGLIDEEVYRGIAGMATADSVTIDPHKFGYIPYPAGSVLFRDYIFRDAVSYGAPYLATDEDAGFGGFLGQWTLEGSRPGAAAVSCYLSAVTLPLTQQGHGSIMRNCVGASKAMVAALKDRFRDAGNWAALTPFSEPDTVGYCFLLRPKEAADTIERLNRFTERIWNRMTVDGREDINQYDFLISRTKVDVKDYEHIISRMIGRDLAREAIATDTPLTLLRTIVMNPFLEDWNRRSPGFAQLFADYLYKAASTVYTEHTLQAFKERTGRRLRILVVESDVDRPGALSRRIQFEQHSAYVDVTGAAWDSLPWPPPGKDDVDKIVLRLAPAFNDAARSAGEFLRSSSVDVDDFVVFLSNDDTVRSGELEGTGIRPQNILRADDDLTDLMRRLCANLCDDYR